MSWDILKEHRLLHEHIGTMGWGAVIGTVALIDFTANETLSSAFRRGLENEHSRPFVLLGLGITALHLLGALPEPYDPFQYLGTMKERIHGSPQKSL